jgi:glycine/D-amino acid oxidase-like deaminating enzyme
VVVLESHTIGSGASSRNSGALTARHVGISDPDMPERGLNQWQLRFEPHILPVTFNLTPSGHFFVRMVLGYASFNSSQWHDIEGAKQLSQRLFEQRYPQIATIGLTHSWHGVTGHTTLMRQIAGRIGDGNIHISVAYNGLGIMAAHNNGYLTACEITGHVDKDTHFLTGTRGQIPMPGDYYRSLMLKPIMSLMTPV